MINLGAIKIIIGNRKDHNDNNTENSMMIETMGENTKGTNRRMIEEPNIINRKRETKGTIVGTTVDT